MYELMYDQLRQDLIRDEGMRLRPYQCTGGKTSIGVGRNLDDVGITEPEAMQMLDNDIERCACELDERLPWWNQLGKSRRRALLNMTFNLGITRLMGFRRMLSALERGQWDKAADEALNSKWARQVGARADRIAALFRGGE